MFFRRITWGNTEHGRIGREIVRPTGGWPTTHLTKARLVPKSIKNFFLS